MEIPGSIDLILSEKRQGSEMIGDDNNKKRIVGNWLCGFFLFTILFLGMFKDQILYAASATIWFEELGTGAAAGQEVSIQMKVSSDVTLGDFEGYIIYNPDVLEYVSGPSCITGGDGMLKIYDIGASPSWEARSYKMTFRALNAGTCLFETTNNPIAYEYETGDAMSVSSSILGLVVAPAPQDSDNARLAAMKINPGTLTPTFDGGIFEYSTVVDGTTERLTVSAVPDDLGCTVTVSGNSELKEGDNTVEIRVKAPAGNELLYTIHVVRETLATPTPTVPPEPEKAEWRFEVSKEGGQTILSGQYFYTVKEKDSHITIPAGYTKTSFQMNGITVAAYSKAEEQDSDFLLLILENEAGETGLYQYDRLEKTIQRYSEKPPAVSNASLSLAEQELLQDAADLQRYEQNISKLSLLLAVSAGLSVLLLISLVYLLIRHKGNRD